MKLNKNILLFLSLIPFLLSIYIASFNIDKKVRLKLLIWQFNEQSIATYILIGTTLGFSLSALNVYLSSAKSTFSQYNFKRTTTKTKFQQKQENKSIDPDEYNLEYQYIERDIREPSPTISIPYRIIKKSSNLNNISIGNKNPNTTNDINDLNQKVMNYNDTNQSAANEDWLSVDLENW